MHRVSKRLKTGVVLLTIVSLAASCSSRDEAASTSGVSDTTPSSGSSETTSASAAPATADAPDSTEPEASDTPTTDTPTTDTPTSDASSGDGDFGTLQNVCGPGDASGATARGVTDTEIVVGVTADPSNPIIPGLGAEFFDAGRAFADWCNEAGGINGRTIVVNEHDAGLFNVGGAMIEACETDFMLVGNGNALDDAGVLSRLGCELAQIPAYQVSVSANEAGLQVQPLPAPVDEWFSGGYEAIAAKYPGIIDATGILGSDQPSQERNNVGPAAAIEGLGGTVLDIQRVPGIPDNWRPFAEAQKNAGVDFLIPGAAAIGYLGTYAQAMNNAGFAPTAMMLDGTAYDAANYEATAEADLPPFYLYLQFWPSELADRSPATSQAIQMLEAANPDGEYNFSYVQGLNAWLLWATAATACGSDLTAECVLEQAAQQSEWTAGGLVPPSDLSLDRLHMNECFLIVRAEPDGWVYEEEMTAPNTEAFNCSPDNVAAIDLG